MAVLFIYAGLFNEGVIVMSAPPKVLVGDVAVVVQCQPRIHNY